MLFYHTLSVTEMQCSISFRICSETVERKGTLPKDLRDAVIVSLYKNKGEKSDCSNYQGIILLSIAGKILACILLIRLIPTIVQENTPESQCGFRSNRGLTNTIMLRQIQEKCREQNMGLSAAFVDLTKGFDTVSHDELQKILACLSYPPPHPHPKVLTILCQLNGNRRPQTETAGVHQREMPVVSSRQRAMKPQRHRRACSIPIILSPNLRLSKVQQGLCIMNPTLQLPLYRQVCKNYQPPQKSSSVRNEPSSVSHFHLHLLFKDFID